MSAPFRISCVRSTNDRTILIQATDTGFRGYEHGNRKHHYYASNSTNARDWLYQQTAKIAGMHWDAVLKHRSIEVVPAFVVEFSHDWAKILTDVTAQELYHSFGTVESSSNDSRVTTDGTIRPLAFSASM